MNIAITLHFLQGRGIPICHLKCKLINKQQNEKEYTTNEDGELQSSYPENSVIQVLVHSSTQSEYKYIGDIQLADSTIPEQHFSVIVDLIKVESVTYPHPTGTEEELFPIYTPKSLTPTKSNERGSNGESSQGTSTIECKDGQGNPLCKVDAKNANLITYEQMKRMWPAAKIKKRDILESIAIELNNNQEKYKIDTPPRKAHFFSQLMIESGPLLKNEESLLYSKSRAKSVFKRISHTPYSNALNYCTDSATPNEVEFGNWIYSSINGNGPYESGDGYKYRGRGLAQITGKGEYKKFNDSYYQVFGEPGSGNYVENPDLVSLTTKDSIRSAVIYWLKNKVWKIADLGYDKSIVLKVSFLINGGATNAKERIEAFKLTKALFR